MSNIRPVSDLHDPFPEVKKPDDSFDPPFTDDPSSAFCTDIEAVLDYADREAEETDVRYSLDEVIERVRRSIREREAV